MKDIVELMKVLGEENRFRISMMLLVRPLCVCELLEVLSIAGGTLSNHLKILRNSGLVEQKITPCRHEAYAYRGLYPVVEAGKVSRPEPPA